MIAQTLDDISPAIWVPLMILAIIVGAIVFWGEIFK